MDPKQITSQDTTKLVTNQMCRREEGKNPRLLWGLRLSCRDSDSGICRKNGIRQDAALEEEEREFGF